MRSPTPQLLDPLGGLTARYFTFLAVGISLVLAAAMIALHWRGIQSLPLQGLAVGCLVVAAIVVVDGTSARRFPFGAARHATVQLLGTAAIVLDTASRPAGAEQFGSWGALCFATLLLLIGSYRPASEILVFTLVPVAVTVVTSVLTSSGLSAPLTVSLAVSRAVPILAIAIGAATFSRTLVVRLDRWRRESDARHELERAVVRGALLPEVTQRRQDLIEYRVGPFLQGVLESGIVTVSDVSRARGLATAMRANMLNDARRNWIAEQVDGLDDPRNLADRMSRDQRTAVGALLAELASAPGLVPGTVRAVATEAEPVSFRFSARFTPEGLAGVRPTAYLAVLRTYFPRATVSSTPDSITVTVTLGAGG